ncbi:TPA: hypothetical protein HA336_04905 [Methanopyrus kandleri]|uniref:Uncharacterized protein n=1 Tax=Methanopyrus kandleri TaxID=2320 RepID=A0A832TCY9_9EURY|nr:hypothetical protein [Methanopyrus kandleri]HII70553.1 hypothetical protein [Methanopyrus kandleri]
MVPAPLALVLSTLLTVQPANSLQWKDCPWIQLGRLSCATQGLAVDYPYDLAGDHLLLVSPLWPEGDHYRVILAAYGVEELPLPLGTRVHRVFVPSEVRRVPWKLWEQIPESPRPATFGPWSEVRYSLREWGCPQGYVFDPDEWDWSELQSSLELAVLLEPERTVDGVFAVEASLPVREDRIGKERWIRLALTPGRWLVLLGWTEDFDVRTPCRTLFRGRALRRGRVRAGRRETPLLGRRVPVGPGRAGEDTTERVLLERGGVVRLLE